MTTLAATAERIRVRSGDFRLGIFLLTLIALPFFGLGWLVRHGYRAVETVCGWIWAAALEGWESARPGGGT